MLGLSDPYTSRTSSATQTRLHQQKNVILEMIWQSIGPSVARRGDTVSTSSGSFVVTGNLAPYDHAVDLHPDTQYGDLPDDEPQTSSQIFTDVINKAFQLIGVSQNGVTPYTLLTEEQRMCTGPETFKDRHLYGYFKQGYLETTGTAFDRTANLLFPHPRSQPHYTKQGWGGFRGHQQYLAVINSKSCVGSLPLSPTKSTTTERKVVRDGLLLGVWWARPGR
ncbi:hypothetical protein DFH08DRAFT_820412 [Mycena albidolilacea]|uniref:Uncharacterized protein n=1 Tax=Mycena albidolilacea TaxID=1033008 RepID=A0AAD6ZCL4_9AGAR|nr:hypothetical protein DFH08DRAFT_820412 [Mycena albidolilacea]